MLLTRVPKDIPIVVALGAGLALLAFGLTALFMDPRPSSTAGIGLILIPIWSFAVGAAGYGLGLVVRTIWTRLANSEADSRRYPWVLPCLLALAVLGASLLGWWDVVETERAAQPAVVLDSGALERSFDSNSDAFVRRSVELYKYDRAPRTISWGRNNSEIVIGKYEVLVRDTRLPKREVIVSTSALNYITKIDAVPWFTKAEADPLLAVVISGRATGRRALILLLESDYTVQLEERLYRFWQPDQTAVEIRKDPKTGAETVVVGPGCEKSLVIRRKAA